MDCCTSVTLTMAAYKYCDIAWTFSEKFGKEGSGVTIDSDDMVYVTESDNHRVSVLTSQGQFVRSFGARGTQPGQFRGPLGITLNKHGLLYISDTDNGRLQIL